MISDLNIPTSTYSNLLSPLGLFPLPLLFIKKFRLHNSIGSQDNIILFQGLDRLFTICTMILTDLEEVISLVVYLLLPLIQQCHGSNNQGSSWGIGGFGWSIGDNGGNTLDSLAKTYPEKEREIEDREINDVNYLEMNGSGSGFSIVTIPMSSARIPPLLLPRSIFNIHSTPSC